MKEIEFVYFITDLQRIDADLDELYPTIELDIDDFYHMCNIYKRSLFGEQGKDYIDWFLYENVNHIIYFGDRVYADLSTVKKLYDYIANFKGESPNKEEVETLMASFNKKVKLLKDHNIDIEGTIVNRLMNNLYDKLK